MSDLKDLARGMATVALNEGQKVAFNTAIMVCDRLAASYEEAGHKDPAKGCRDCAKLIAEMRDLAMRTS